MAESEYDMKRQQDDIQQHLDMIRKTIADSKAMVDKVQLRIQETDRLLAAQGLTREQVMGFQFTDEQRELVNRELERRGLTPLDFSSPEGFDQKTDQVRSGAEGVDTLDRPTEAMVDLDERASRFKMMMNAYRVS